MITAKVAPGEFTELAAKLKAEAGLVLTGNKGELETHGAKATYEYDGVGELRIQVTHAPFPVSKGFCEGKLRDALAAHGVTCV